MSLNVSSLEPFRSEKHKQTVNFLWAAHIPGNSPNQRKTNAGRSSC